MWTTTVYSLSHVVDHPMSSPCCVAKAGPVLAYRIMYLNDVVPASSPMISLDIAEFFWLEQRSSEGNKRPSGLASLSSPQSLPGST